MSVLLPHLDREVEEAMPVVSRSISLAEWRAVEQRYNIKPKRLPQLGMEGHWLLDGIDAEGYSVVMQTAAGGAIRVVARLRPSVSASRGRAVGA